MFNIFFIFSTSAFRKETICWYSIHGAEQGLVCAPLRVRRVWRRSKHAHEVLRVRRAAGLQTVLREVPPGATPPPTPCAQLQRAPLATGYGGPSLLRNLNRITGVPTRNNNMLLFSRVLSTPIHTLSFLFLYHAKWRSRASDGKPIHNSYVPLRALNIKIWRVLLRHPYTSTLTQEVKLGILGSSLFLDWHLTRFDTSRIQTQGTTLLAVSSIFS